MAINMGGGIDRQLGEQTDRFRTNPQAMQGAQQEVQRATRSGIAPDMIKALALQKVTDDTAKAAEAIAMSMNQQPGTIVAQRAEALQAKTAQEITGQVSATLNQRDKQAGQKMAQLQKELGTPAAGPQMASGGIVGYQAGGSAGAVSSEQKATTILKSMGLTPDQYNSMPPEGQQRVLASLKSMGGGAPARPAPQMMGIAQQPAPQMMGIAQQPAPNMARMAGGGIVAFASGGSVDDPDADYIPGPEYARQLEIRNNMFRAVGLTPEVYDKLSVEGRQEISAIIRGVEVASPENLRETMPRQIARILNREAAALKPPREDPLGIGLFGSEGGEQAKVNDAYKATGPNAEAEYAEALAAQKENNLRAANLRAAAETANKTGFSEFWNSGSSSPNPNLFAPPPAAAPAAAPAAQRPPDVELSPQQAAQGVLGAEIAVPELTAPPLPGTKLASGAVPAAEKARLAGRLGGIDAVNRELRNAGGIDAARERAKFVNSPIAFNRQANMDRAQAGIARLQGIRSRQAADVAEYNRNNPFRNFAGLGIGSFAQYGVNQQNQMARNRAAELAEEAEINKRELGITAAELTAGKVAAEAGAQGFADVAAGQRQASANQTSLYNTESRKAENAAKNLLTKSMAELTAEQQNIKQAFAFQSAIFTDASRRRTAQIAGAATIAAAQIKTISDDKKRRVEAADAMAKFRKDLEETYRKVRQDITSRPNLTPEQTKQLLQDAQDAFGNAVKATGDLFADALADGQPLLSVEPE
tara:strand:+ start:1836 stop:4112 length:2277 start_codon:yes stop_codon:yes gene_type:complete